MATYFDLLVDKWIAYVAAMKAEPYDADRVQALGMAFADEWHRIESYIEQHFPAPEGVEFDYMQHRRVMRELKLISPTAVLDS